MLPDVTKETTLTVTRNMQKTVALATYFMRQYCRVRTILNVLCDRCRLGIFPAIGDYYAGITDRNPRGVYAVHERVFRG